MCTIGPINYDPPVIVLYEEYLRKAAEIVIYSHGCVGTHCPTKKTNCSTACEKLTALREEPTALPL